MADRCAPSRLFSEGIEYEVLDVVRAAAQQLLADLSDADADVGWAGPVLTRVR